MPTNLDPETAAFEQLQGRLAPLFEKVFPVPLEPRTVVVVPSLSLDADLLAKIAGVQHYEERLLCMLMLLRLPRTRVVFVTSLPVASTIIDYYLHLLPGIPGSHARRRLTMLSCHDASSCPLSEKILQRPRLLARIRAAIPDPSTAHMTCFNVSPLERSLALALDIPLYGCDPALADPGGKSGSREVFREAGLDLPAGFERLRDAHDIIDGLVALKRLQPGLRKAVVKLEEGASGEGNAVFSFEDAPESGLESWVKANLASHLRFEAEGESWANYHGKFEDMGGIVEAWIDGPDKRSPSVQCRIDPLARVDMISTHDQILGGPTGQAFKGSTFPADPAYRRAIQAAGERVADVLRSRSILGRFGVDFISVPEASGWRHYAIEINLRKGGTTHTFMMLQFLTDGHYDTETGLYLTPAGQPRFYRASDNLESPRYHGLLPRDLIDIAVANGLHFHGATQQGVVFHLIGALSEFGKLGLLCVADSAENAQALYDNTVRVLDRETAG